MIGAVVLAAGSSERMGRPKAELELPDGTRFLDAIVGKLASMRIDTIRVVVGPLAAVAVPSPAESVVNPDPARGMLSSVQCGLRALPEGCEAALLWPVDHPRVDIGTLATILAAHRAHGAEVVVPLHDGRRGHPVLVAGAAIAEIVALTDGATTADVVHAHDERIEIAVADPGIGDDIDDPEDYARVFGRSP